MATDIRALVTLAQTYFDAAYEMDADAFASIFHPSSSVSSIARAGEDINVSVTPIAARLTVVRNTKAPKELGLERCDEILSIDIARDIAVVKLKLQIPPRYFTDLLSCLQLDGVWKIVQKVTAAETLIKGPNPTNLPSPPQ